MIVSIVVVNTDGKKSTAFGKICEHCGKRNHFAAMCLQRKHAGKRDNTTKPHVNAVSNRYDDLLSVDYDANGHLHIHTVSKSQYKSKILLTSHCLTRKSQCILILVHLAMCYQKSLSLLEQKSNYLTSPLASTEKLACL